MQPSDAAEREVRAHVQQEAFAAFDLEGSAHISSIDLAPALTACDFFSNEDVTLREEDLTWAMKRHGVSRGGLVTLAQFRGIAEALYKQKVEPKIRERLRAQRAREEAEREELERVRQQAAARQRKIAAREYRTAQDVVARSFYAFDADDSGEVSGVDATRMLQMAGCRGVADAEVDAALARLQKTRGSLFTLDGFRALHALVSGGDGFGGKKGKPQQQQPPAPAPTPTPATPPPGAALQRPASSIVSSVGPQQGLPPPAAAPGQQGLPFDLPPPCSVAKVMSTPDMPDIEVHKANPPLLNLSANGQTPPDAALQQAQQQLAMPPPTRRLVTHQNQPDPSGGSDPIPTDMASGSHNIPPSTVAGYATAAAALGHTMSLPMPEPTPVSPAGLTAVDSTNTPLGAFHMPAGVAAAMAVVGAGSPLHHTYNSVTSSAAAAAAAPAQPERFSSAATSAQTTTASQPPLKKVRVIGDVDRLRDMVTGHPHIAAWTHAHASHVGAHGVVLRDNRKKDAVGLRFPDGEVAWYPSACVIEYDTRPAPPPLAAPRSTVGPADVPLTRLFARLPQGGAAAAAADDQLDTCWPSVSTTSADGPPLPEPPLGLRHHLQHSAEHCVPVDEFGDDVPGAAPGGACPDDVPVGVAVGQPPPSTSDITSLPDGERLSRYGPPPRGAYQALPVPKYDITELDTIYPLGKKKAEVRSSEVRQVFDLFDIEREGEVPRRELAMMLRSLGFVVPDQEVRAMLDKSGKRAAGNMSVDEFSAHAEACGRGHRRSKQRCDLTQFNSTHKRTASASLRNLFFLFHDGGDEGTLTRQQLTVCLNAVGLEDSHEVDIFLEVDRIFGDPNIDRRDTRICLETFQRLVKQLQSAKFSSHVHAHLTGRGDAAADEEPAYDRDIASPAPLQQMSRNM